VPCPLPCAFFMQTELRCAVGDARSLLQPPRPDPSSPEGAAWEADRQARRAALAAAKEKERAAAAEAAAAAEVATKKGGAAKPAAPAKGAPAAPAPVPRCVRACLFTKLVTHAPGLCSWYGSFGALIILGKGHPHPLLVVMSLVCCVCCVCVRCGVVTSEPAAPVGSDASLPLDVATAAALAQLFDVKRGVEVAGGPLCAWLRDVVSLD
jgi:hypothetical protein